MKLLKPFYFKTNFLIKFFRAVAQEIKRIADNGFGLGEVAFVRWLVCRKAILPNPCYMKCRLIYDDAQLEH